MAMEGSWDIGCGVYAWNIIVPDPSPDSAPTMVPLTVFSQSCYQEANFPGHADVQPQDVLLGAAVACGQVPATMNAESPKWTPPKPLYGRSGYELMFAVEWKGGCVTEVEEQSPRDPLGEKGGTNLCHSLFFNSWYDCVYISFSLATAGLKRKKALLTMSQQARRTTGLEAG